MESAQHLPDFLSLVGILIANQHNHPDWLGARGPHLARKWTLSPAETWRIFVMEHFWRLVNVDKVLTMMSQDLQNPYRSGTGRGEWRQCNYCARRERLGRGAHSAGGHIWGGRGAVA